MAVEEEDAGGIPEWVVTFGDMMSLLLTFFIMLVSLSEIKSKERYQAMVDSMRRQFGHDSSRASMAPGDHKPRNAQLAKLATEGRAKRAHTFNGGDKVRAPVGDNPRVENLHPGEKKATGGALFFAVGSTELNERNKRDLQRIALEIGGKRQKIEIRGHTSNLPIPDDAPFKDKWQIAHLRCRIAMDFLVSLGIDPQRIRLVAAGPHEPARLAEDPELLKQNERVEIYLLAEVTEEFQGTEQEKSERYLSEDTQDR